MIAVIVILLITAGVIASVLTGSDSRRPAERGWWPSYRRDGS